MVRVCCGDVNSYRTTLPGTNMEVDGTTCLFVGTWSSELMAILHVTMLVPGSV